MLADAGYDPFERVASGLLLAEEFARADLTDRTTSRAWYEQHGVLDIAHYFPEDEFESHDHIVASPAFHDSPRDVEQQQINVRWHLLSLARLSDHLQDGAEVRQGWAPSDSWDPRWVQPVLRAPMELVWLGGRTKQETHIEPLMQHGARPEDVFKDTPLSELKLPFGMKPKAYLEWWRHARAAYERIIAEEIPILWVPDSDWAYEWSEYDVTAPPSGRQVTGRLSSDWWGLVELERRLLSPYVRRAAEHIVEIRRVGYERDLSREGERMRDVFPGPLAVHERRWWGSLLAPVYLQLLEGLLRVTEGQRGAAFCRECGQPFLTLDARRSSFCTDRERYRFGQRERRRRLSALSPEMDEVLDLLDHQIDEEERSERAIKTDLASPDQWLPEKVAKTLRRRKRYR